MNPGAEWPCTSVYAGSPPGLAQGVSKRVRNAAWRAGSGRCLSPQGPGEALALCMPAL